MKANGCSTCAHCVTDSGFEIAGGVMRSFSCARPMDAGDDIGTGGFCDAINRWMAQRFEIWKPSGRSCPGHLPGEPKVEASAPSS